MATFHVDPSAPVNGNGTIGSPYNTPASVSAGAGDAVLFRRGTTWASPVTVANGTSAAPVLYGTYGDPLAPKPRIWTADAAGGCFIAHDRRWVTIQDFDLALATVACVFGYQDASGNGSGITLRRLDCHDAGSGSIFYPYTWGGAIIADFLAEDCNFERMASAGASVYGRVGSAMYRRCRFDRNALTDVNGSHGATSFAHRFDGGAADFTLGTGTRYSKSLTNLLDGAGVFGTPTQVFAVVRRTGVQRMLVNAGVTTTPGAGQYGVSGGVLYFDFGALIGDDRIMVYVGEAKGIVYEDCEFSRTKRSNFEGAGVQADDGSSITVRRCKSWGNEGPGVLLNQGSGSLIEFSEFRGNGDHGVQASIGNGNVVRNNTIYGNAGDGIAFLFQSTGTAHEANNNLVHGNAGVGLRGPAEIDANNNALEGNTGGTHAGGVGAKAPVTGDLGVGADMRPRPGSQLLTAGFDLGYLRDMDRKQVRRSVGAYGAATLKPPL